MNAWSFGKLQKKYTQNLTRCDIQFEIWRVFKKLIQNLTRCENFNSKTDAFFFKSKIQNRDF